MNNDTRLVIKCRPEDKEKYMQLSDNLSGLIRELLNEQLELNETLSQILETNNVQTN